MTGARGRLLPILAVTGAGLALIVGGAGGLALSRSGGTAPGPPGPARVAAPAVRVVAAAPPAASRPVALPVELTVPAIGVRTRLIRLGLTPSGTLQVPDRFTVAGWYDRSPRPGATGAAIIAGHIDSVSGPAVTYRLDSLRPGNLAYVRRADGTVAVFRVTAVALYPRTVFPPARSTAPPPAPSCA